MLQFCKFVVQLPQLASNVLPLERCSFHLPALSDYGKTFFITPYEYGERLQVPSLKGRDQF